jgi:hypothetical protein
MITMFEGISHGAKEDKEDIFSFARLCASFALFAFKQL